MNSDTGLDVTDDRRGTMASSTVYNHPLQDVTLTSSSPDSDSANRAQKGNWVKFEDETATSSGNENILSDDRNNLSAAQAPVTAAKTAAAKLTPTSTSAIPRPTTPTTNKLSPPPPRQKKQPSQQQQQQQPHQLTNTNATAATISATNTTGLNRNSVAVAPVQRTSTAADVAPAVLTTESTHVNLNASVNMAPKTNFTNSSQVSSTNTASITPSSGGPQHNSAGKSSISIPVESTPPMRTIELSTGRIREGFANGDVIVTLLPANTKWPWVTPAIFRPELVPEELMAQGLTLTVEDYVHAMETLVNDYRFTLYNICYKRILICWILFAFGVLLTLLFSGLQGVALFSLGVGWLFLNAAAIFLCMWVKLRLARGLEKCLARVNKQLIKHKILLILDDRGRISCHKVNLCFLYFDASPCVSFLNEFLEQTEQNGGGTDSIQAGWEAKLDLDVNDIVIQGNNPMRLSRKQEWGMQLYLRYGSRWGNEALRGLVDVSPADSGRHCTQFLCPCQYIKQHLQCKPRGKLKFLNFIYWVLASERYD